MNRREGSGEGKATRRNRMSPRRMIRKQLQHRPLFDDVDHQMQQERLRKLCGSDNVSHASTAVTDHENSSSSGDSHPVSPLPKSSTCLPQRPSGSSSSRSSQDTAPIDVDSLTEYVPRPCDEILARGYVDGVPPRHNRPLAPPRRTASAMSSLSWNSPGRPTPIQRRKVSNESSRASHSTVSSRPIDVDTLQDYDDETLSMDSHSNHTKFQIQFDTNAFAKQDDSVSVITKRTFLLSCTDETVGPMEAVESFELLDEESYDNIILDEREITRGLIGYMPGFEPPHIYAMHKQSFDIPESIPENEPTLYIKGGVEMFEV